MKSRFDYGRLPHCAVSIVCNDDDNRTVQGLAYTPSELMNMVKQGIPISSSNVSQLPTQGVMNPSWDVPLECKRGTDVSDLWNAERASRSTVGKIYSKEKSKRDFEKSLSEQRDKEVLAQAKRIVEQQKTT